MKNTLLTISIMLISFSLFGQVSSLKIFEKKYSEIPIKLRIENSGNYFVASFDIDNGNVWLNAFDSKESFCYNRNTLINKVTTNADAKDFVIASQQLQKPISPANPYKFNNVKFKKIFLNNTPNVFSDSDGELSNSTNDKISLKILNKAELEINYLIQGFNKSLKLFFPANLAYADIIGVDKNENSYILVETYITEVPLEVRREVYTVSSAGQTLSILEIPSIKYIYTVRDFQIDAEGNLYHLISDKKGISIIKWSSLCTYSNEKIPYPTEYNYELHYNNLSPIEEPTNEILKLEKVFVNRTTALRIGETYVLNKYQCSQNNLAPINITGPDGDVVRTPSWLVVGTNSKVPYKWGGFNTIAQFNAGIAAGKYAGDINTGGVSSYAVGVDCSGFVSRCWQLGSQVSTSGMPNITTLYSGWDQMKPGDAVFKIGHVRLYVGLASNGTLRVVESSGRDWGVSYWSYAPSDLTSYSPRYYNQMASDFSVKVPTLLMAHFNSDGLAKIGWYCDTTGILGYRLYKSIDGSNWSMVLDENALKNNVISYDMTNNVEYYRVSSVLNNPPYFTESNWSNILGASKKVSSKKILIIDGFNRDGGDWRGNGHPFAMYYGKALDELNLRFLSLKNSQVIDSSITLYNYDAVFWILGDESTANETFDSVEQIKVKKYLEEGGNLFVSGSEIGWDLSAQGSPSDLDFYNNYLKAEYISDNASSTIAKGVNSDIFSGMNFNYSQGYPVGYPDEIGVYGGSSLCLQYGNNKGAGVKYSGTFGNSSAIGKIINIGFPVETIANDTTFNSIIAKAIYYFFPELNDVRTNNSLPLDFTLSQNYPNPFNPSTEIRYYLPKNSLVTLKIYDVLGKELTTLVNEVQTSGEKKVSFTAAGLSSGIYFYTIKAGEFFQTKKMILMK